MAAGDGDRVDQLLPEFLGHLLQIGLRELAQIGREFHLVEQRGPIADMGRHGAAGRYLRSLCHGLFPLQPSMGSATVLGTLLGNHLAIERSAYQFSSATQGVTLIRLDRNSATIGENAAGRVAHSAYNAAHYR